MANISETECNIIDILKSKPKEPFSINLTINNSDGSTEDLFNKIKDIFVKGLMIQSGREIENSLNIKDIDMEHIEIMRQHMLSMGIDVKLRKYNRGTKDYLFRDLLYDIQNVENLEIKVLKDWNTDLIEKINISLKITNNDMTPLNTYNKAIKKHFRANHFLKLGKPNVLHDYAILVQNENEDDVSVLYFDYAKRGDYPKIYKCVM